MESRIVDLEIRFMHQESTLLELNEVIINQQKQIDDLIREIDLLKKQMKALNPSLSRVPSEETTPPHY